MLFAGQYEAKIERRGKILLPKMFVNALSKQHFKGVYVFPSLSGEYLEGCGEAWLAYWSRKMDEQDSLSGKKEILLSNIMDMMAPLEFDKSGRIMLPQELINHADLTSPLMIVGRGFRFQIWKRDQFFAHRNHMRAQYHVLNRLNKVEHDAEQDAVLELKPQSEPVKAKAETKPTKTTKTIANKTKTPNAAKKANEKEAVTQSKATVKKEG